MEGYLFPFDIEEIKIDSKNNKEIMEYILQNLYKYTNLKKFICSNYIFQSSKLPELPNSLIELDCSKCNLKELPENLPISLQEINCSFNIITRLPEELPKGLINLNCSDNRLNELPKLPNTLRDLDCCYNSLNKLPELPITLRYIDCNFNFLNELPKLPNKLKYLDCCDNSLNELPQLPNTLRSLFCVNNYFDNFPDLPDMLIHLICPIKLTLFTEKEINTIKKEQSENRIMKRMKLLNRNLLLEWSAIITMNPKRIERLLENGEINFFDGSFSSLL